jgi:GntR family transcriptional regulator
VLPFHVTLQPGESPYRQVVFAATRAIVSGELGPGASFPSVRELSQALKVNPNTAHKVVAELIRDGLLVALPGVGTVVTRNRRASSAERRRLLSAEVEQLVVEAKRLGLGREEILDAVNAQWAGLTGEEPITAAPRARAARRSGS